MNQNFRSDGYVETGSVLTRYGIERIIISGTVNWIVGAAVIVGLKSFGLSIIAAISAALLLTTTGMFFLAKRLPSDLVGIRKQKPILCTLWIIVALVGVVQISRLSVFMIDPVQSQYSMFPWDKWMVEHCCLTAYSESAKFVSEDEKNIYKTELYFGEEWLVNKEFRRKLDGFNVDPYHYPPPFLLLPTMVRAVVGGSFLDIRMLWFAISALSLMTAISVMFYRLEPEGRMRLIATAPLIWCSMPVLAGLQMSNVQIIVISISIIAMALFSISRPIGGMLLAMSTVAKIFPGILGIFLIVQKKFKEVLWTIVFAVLLSVIAFIVVGSDPFKAFINYELPRLSSGEAFVGPFSRAFAVARNMAPFGIPIKLGWLGVPGMTLEIGRIVSYIHLFMVVLLAIWSGRQKPRSNTEMISCWISLIALGSLVSPFAPANYVLVSVILLVCLNHEHFSPLATIIIWLMICIPFFISREATFFIQVLAYLPAQFITIAVPAFVLYQAGLRTVREKEILNTQLATEGPGEK